jgi:hypothetical protein
MASVSIVLWVITTVLGIRGLFAFTHDVEVWRSKRKARSEPDPGDWYDDDDGGW